MVGNGRTSRADGSGGLLRWREFAGGESHKGIAKHVARRLPLLYAIDVRLRRANCRGDFRFGPVALMENGNGFGRGHGYASYARSHRSSILLRVGTHKPISQIIRI